MLNCMTHFFLGHFYTGRAKVETKEEMMYGYSDEAKSTHSHTLLQKLKKKFSLTIFRALFIAGRQWDDRLHLEVKQFNNNNLLKPTPLLLWDTSCFSKRIQEKLAGSLPESPFYPRKIVSFGMEESVK